MSPETLVGLLVAYGYWIVFAAILFDNAGLPIPGELVLLTLGGMARSDLLDPMLGLAAATAGALAGDSLAYCVGRLGGPWVRRRLPVGHGLAMRRRSMILGKFVFGARAFLAPLAGAGRMPYRRFVVFDAVGALAWAGLFIGLGYSVGAQLAAIQSALKAVAIVTLAALAVGAAGFLAVRHLRAAPQSL
jgi:membrane protein DedA with SNARE-associated domain